MRLLLQITDAVRDVWPSEKPLFVRLSATDWVDQGWDVAQSVELSAMLAARGVDLIDVSTGGNVATQIPIGRGYQVPFSRQIRQQARVRTGAVGIIVDPAQAEDVLASGDADVVLLARAALREPGWPLRAAAELGVAWRDAPYPAAHLRGKWDDALTIA